MQQRYSPIATATATVTATAKEGTEAFSFLILAPLKHCKTRIMGEHQRKPFSARRRPVHPQAFHAHALVDFSLQIQALGLTFVALLGTGVAQSQSSTTSLMD